MLRIEETTTLGEYGIKALVGVGVRYVRRFWARAFIVRKLNAFFGVSREETVSYYHELAEKDYMRNVHSLAPAGIFSQTDPPHFMQFAGL